MALGSVIFGRTQMSKRSRVAMPTALEGSGSTTHRPLISCASVQRPLGNEHMSMFAFSSLCSRQPKNAARACK